MLRRALFAVMFFTVAASAATTLSLSPRSEKHVRESHFAGGSRSRGKSLFLPDTDLLKLLKAADAAKPRRQANGRDKRVSGGETQVGTDGRTGKAVKSYVVISEPGGAVVTMYPGR